MVEDLLETQQTLPWDHQHQLGLWCRMLTIMNEVISSDQVCQYGVSIQCLRDCLCLYHQRLLSRPHIFIPQRMLSDVPVWTTEATVGGVTILVACCWSFLTMSSDGSPCFHHACGWVLWMAYKGFTYLYWSYRGAVESWWPPSPRNLCNLLIWPGQYSTQLTV
jgi:hypothetical protein